MLRRALFKRDNGRRGVIKARCRRGRDDWRCPLEEGGKIGDTIAMSTPRTRVHRYRLNRMKSISNMIGLTVTHEMSEHDECHVRRGRMKFYD